MALRWGIAGAGNISSDFTISVRCLPDEHHKAFAVGSRDLSRAEAFKQKHGMERAYGSYEEMAKDPNVDVVYVGVISPLHYEVAKLFLEHGKHVLCEKPFTINKKEAEKLIALAKSKNLFLTHGIWSRCFPLYKKVAEAIKDKVIGDVKYAHCTFGNAMKRAILRENGNGSLLDVGIYAIQFISLAFNKEAPTKILAVGHLNETGADKSVCASFEYASGGTASISTSTEAKYPCEGVIYGTKGSIKLHYPFWCPTKLTISGEDFEVSIPANTTKDIPKGRNSTGFQYQAEEVRQCLLKDQKECPLITNEETLLIMSMMDSIRSQIGVFYPSEV